MRLENELGHDAELTTPRSADSPEEILVLLVVGDEATSLAGDDGGLVEIV